MADKIIARYFTAYSLIVYPTVKSVSGNIHLCFIKTFFFMFIIYMILAGKLI